MPRQPPRSTLLPYTTLFRSNTNHAAVKARTIGARAHRYQSMASKKTITKPRALNSPRDHTTVIVIKEPTQVINHKSNHQRPLRHGCVTPSNMDKANKNQASTGKGKLPQTLRKLTQKTAATTSTSTRIPRNGQR